MLVLYTKPYISRDGLLDILCECFFRLDVQYLHSKFMLEFMPWMSSCLEFVQDGFSILQLVHEELCGWTWCNVALGGNFAVVLHKTFSLPLGELVSKLVLLFGNLCFHICQFVHVLLEVETVFRPLLVPLSCFVKLCNLCCNTQNKFHSRFPIFVVRGSELLLNLAVTVVHFVVISIMVVVVVCGHRLITITLNSASWICTCTCTWK